MSTTRERLAELEAAEFDTFGEQDKGDGVWSLATPEEVQSIDEVVFSDPWTDPARYPECMRIAFDALAAISILDNPVAFDATQALRKMGRRAEFGGPLDEDHRFQAGES